MQFFTADLFHDLHHLIVKILTSSAFFFSKLILMRLILTSLTAMKVSRARDILEHLILLHPRQFQAELAFNFFHFYPTDL